MIDISELVHHFGADFVLDPVLVCLLLFKLKPTVI